MTDDTELLTFDSWERLLSASQEAQVRRSLKLCRVQRIPWLLHIDDDEILHLDVPFSAIAHHAPEGICAGPRFSLCRPRAAGSTPTTRS